MTFIPLSNHKRLVPGFGGDTAKIAIVGDYTSGFDDKMLKPFSGPAGNVLEQCLHAAGLIRADVYLTNAFKSQTRLSGKQANMDFFDEGKKKFTDLGMEHAEMLRKELAGIKANVIVVAGNPGLRALSDLSSCAKYRGYVCAANKLNNRKIIPTHSFTATIRGAFHQRHVIVSDLQKAKQECEIPEIIRHERQLIYDFANIEEVLQWLEYYMNVPLLCFDIEVINYEVSCISLSASKDLACVIPIGPTDTRPQGWREDEELQIWRAVDRVLGNPASEKIVQNGMFDIHFLLTRCGIVVRGKIHDTMIAHSVMYPELPKGLDFLGSIYCGSQEYWKDSVRFDNIKGES
jgi:uracil-DNA glycosylase family 4